MRSQVNRVVERVSRIKISFVPSYYRDRNLLIGACGEFLGVICGP
jgi:hypothetical protein